MKKIIFTLIVFVLFAAMLDVANSITTLSTTPLSGNSLSERSFSMAKRYNNDFVNGVFRDNILLTLEYLSGDKINPKGINWQDVNKPKVYKLTLKPGETFAFHDDVLPEYKNKVDKTSNAHFNAAEGFRTSGALYGDGVCHLASFLYWVALDAGLTVNAPVRHDFAKIPEVPREYGVSIYATPGSQAKDQVQNLYITNNKKDEVTFEFTYDGQNLKVAALEANQKLASR